jgi:hypothetical protein
MQQEELYPTAPGQQLQDIVLRKHVNAIALMPTVGGGRISVPDRRLFDVLLYLAQEQGHQPEYSAGLSEILKLAEFNSNNTAEIKKSLTRLMKTPVEWQSPTTGEMEDWEICVLISGGGIRKNKQTKHVTFHWRYDSKVQAQLLDPDRYGRLMLRASIRLGTYAAMALYGICARYIDNPGRRTSRQHWRWWKPVLAGVAGREGEYRYWKRDTLLPAIAEINANTELEISPPIEYKERDNKTIADIQFEVREKPRALRAPAPAKLPLAQITPEDLPVIGEALEVGVTQTEAEALFHAHGVEALSAGVQELKKRLQMPAGVASPLGSPGAWLKAVMRNKPSPVNEGAKPTHHATGRPTQDLEKNKTALTEEWLRRKKDNLRALFRELPQSDQDGLLAAFRRTLTLAPILKRFDLQGWDHRMVRDNFAAFLGEQWEGTAWATPNGDDILLLALEQSTVPDR